MLSVTLVLGKYKNSVIANTRTFEWKQYVFILVSCRMESLEWVLVWGKGKAVLERGEDDVKECAKCQEFEAEKCKLTLSSVV